MIEVNQRYKRTRKFTKLETVKPLQTYKHKIKGNIFIVSITKQEYKSMYNKT